MKNKKILASLLVMIMLAGFLIGCTSSETGGLSTGEPQMLRIMGGWGDDSYIRSNYTDYFELTHNVEIDVVPIYETRRNFQEEEEEESPIDRIKRIMTEDNPPDVIILEDLSMFSQLVEEGLLQPLDSYIEKSNFDINDLVPAVREGIKEAGDGSSMYGLTPSFSSQALFYNKNLFDQRSVQYPTDNMTWDQIAELAKQLNSGEGADRIYGFWSSDGHNIHHFLSVFAAPLELSMFNEDFTNVTFNTPLWESTLTKYVSYVQDEVFPKAPDWSAEYTPEMDLFWQAFYSGKAAMAVLHSWELQNMEYRMYDSENMNFDWDVVTVPTHAEAPGIGGSIYFQGILAINRNAQNSDLAWDFVQFINGEEMLKLKSRQKGQFVSRESLIQNNTESGPSNLQAFYTLLPASNPLSAAYQNGGEKVWEVMSIAEQVFGEILNGDKTVQEGLDEMQLKGQEIMNQ